MVFFGCGSIMMFQVQPEIIDPLGIPFAFGAAVMMMIYTFGHISGAHFNPAVTLAFWVIKKFPAKKILGYFSAQFSGAALAMLALNYIWQYTDNDFGMTKTLLEPEVALLVEVIISFCLMLVIAAVATDSRAEGQMAGLAIGTTIALCALIAGPLTGASMNPARSILPAIAEGDFHQLWIYIIGPFVGCSLGALTYNFVRCDYTSFEL